MKVILKPIGDLRDYFGREPQEIELPHQAVVRDLLEVIAERWGKRPAYVSVGCAKSRLSWCGVLCCEWQSP